MFVWVAFAVKTSSWPHETERIFEKTLVDEDGHGGAVAEDSISLNWKRSSMGY